MATVSIEGGCVNLGGNTWVYKWSSVTGFHENVFTSAEGVNPKVGDSIVDNVLVPLVGYKTNQDHSRWIKYPPETYGRQNFPSNNNR